MSRVILDTNTLVAGLKSRNGASFRLLQLIAQGKVAPAVTTPLVFEYQMVLGRSGLLPSEFSSEDIDRFIDWFVFSSSHHRVHYLWRPHLSDPKDDLVLEAAFSSKSGYIVTFNERHFRGAVELGIVVISPVNFLRHLDR